VTCASNYIHEARYEVKCGLYGEHLPGGDDTYLIYVGRRTCSKCGPRQAHVFVSWDDELEDAALRDWPGPREPSYVSEKIAVEMDCEGPCEPDYNTDLFSI